MANDEQPKPENSDAAVIELFRRIYGAVGDNARADQTMLGLWLTMLTGRPAAALVAYRRLVDDDLPWLSPPPAPPSRDATERREIESASADRRRRNSADDAERHGGLVAW